MTVCLFGICLAQHFGLKALSKRIQEITEVAEMQGGWVYIEIEQDD